MTKTSISKHVYGSTDLGRGTGVGYQTIAMSPGLAPDVVRMLEDLARQFEPPGDDGGFWRFRPLGSRAYMVSRLAHAPAFGGRAVHSAVSVVGDNATMAQLDPAAYACNAQAWALPPRGELELAPVADFDELPQGAEAGKAIAEAVDRVGGVDAWLGWWAATLHAAEANTSLMWVNDGEEFDLISLFRSLWLTAPLTLRCALSLQTVWAGTKGTFLPALLLPGPSGERSLRDQRIAEHSRSSPPSRPKSPSSLVNSEALSRYLEALENCVRLGDWVGAARLPAAWSDNPAKLAENVLAWTVPATIEGANALVALALRTANNTELLARTKASVAEWIERAEFRDLVAVLSGWSDRAAALLHCPQLVARIKKPGGLVEAIQGASALMEAAGPWMRRVGADLLQGALSAWDGNISEADHLRATSWVLGDPAASRLCGSVEGWRQLVVKACRMAWAKGDLAVKAKLASSIEMLWALPEGQADVLALVAEQSPVASPAGTVDWAISASESCTFLPVAVRSKLLTSAIEQAGHHAAVDGWLRAASATESSTSTSTLERTLAMVVGEGPFFGDDVALWQRIFEATRLRSLLIPQELLRSLAQTPALRQMALSAVGRDSYAAWASLLLATKETLTQDELQVFEGHPEASAVVARALLDALPGQPLCRAPDFTPAQHPNIDRAVLGLLRIELGRSVIGHADSELAYYHYWLGYLHDFDLQVAVHGDLSAGKDDWLLLAARWHRLPSVAVETMPRMRIATDLVTQLCGGDKTALARLKERPSEARVFVLAKCCDLGALVAISAQLLAQAKSEAHLRPLYWRDIWEAWQCAHPDLAGAAMRTLVWVDAVQSNESAASFFHAVTIWARSGKLPAPHVAGAVGGAAR